MPNLPQQLFRLLRNFSDEKLLNGHAEALTQHPTPAKLRIWRPATSRGPQPRRGALRSASPMVRQCRAASLFPLPPHGLRRFGDRRSLKKLPRRSSVREPSSTSSRSLAHLTQKHLTSQSFEPMSRIAHIALTMACCAAFALIGELWISSVTTKIPVTSATLVDERIYDQCDLSVSIKPGNPDGEIILITRKLRWPDALIPSTLTGLVLSAWYTRPRKTAPSEIPRPDS